MIGYVGPKLDNDIPREIVSKNSEQRIADYINGLKNFIEIGYKTDIEKIESSQLEEVLKHRKILKPGAPEYFRFLENCEEMLSPREGENIHIQKLSVLRKENKAIKLEKDYTLSHAINNLENDFEFNCVVQDIPDHCSYGSKE